MKREWEKTQNAFKRLSNAFKQFSNALVRVLFFPYSPFHQEGHIHRHECSTVKYTARKIHTKLHSGPEWYIFHILTGQDIDGVTSRFNTIDNDKRMLVYTLKRKLHGGLKI